MAGACKSLRWPASQSITPAELQSAGGVGRGSGGGRRTGVAGFGQLGVQLHAQGAVPRLFAASSQVAGDVRELPGEFSRRVFLAYPFVPGDWTAEGRAALAQVRQRSGLKGAHAVQQVGAYSSLLLLSEGIKQAGRDASREKLLAALEGLHDFATGLTPPISFGPGQRMGLRGAHIVTLDGRGKPYSSEQLGQRLEHWRQQGRDLAFLVGGPEGHSAEVIAAAGESWSLGPLTLPHMLVRLVLAEQLYRAASLLANHPYLRA